MREAVFAVLLVISALSGCLQEGEDLEPTDVDTPDNASADDNGQMDGGDDTNGTDDQSSTTTNSTGSQDASDGGNGTAGADDDASGSSDDGSSDDAPKKAPWNLSKEIQVGFQVGVGAGFLPAPVGSTIGNNGLVTSTYCPSANVTVPKTTGNLTISLDGALVDADEPGVGAYEVEVAGPSGANASLGGLDALNPATDAPMEWATEDATAGIWSLSANMIGPAVQQTWTVSIVANGTAKSAPTDLPIEVSC